MSLSHPYPYPYPFPFPGSPEGGTVLGEEETHHGGTEARRKAGRSGTGTGTGRGTGSGTGTLRFFWRPVACVLLAAGAVVAEDRVLVPLDAADTDRWLSRVLGALDDIDRRNYREAIDVLQSGLLEGEGQGLPGAPLAAGGRAGHRANAVIFRVHGPVGRGTSKLRSALAPPPLPDDAAEAGPQRGGMSRRHLPLSRICLAALSSLPPDGLRVYRDLHDQVALRILAESGSANGDPLSVAEKRVASDLFLTTSGDDCAEKVGDAAFESGEPREAAVWWRKILEEYPDSDIPAARLRAKVLHALRLAGDEGGYLIERERFLESAGGSGHETVAAIERSVPLVRPDDRPAPAEPSRWGGELHASRPPDLVPPPAQGGLLQPPGNGGAPGVRPAPAFRLSWDSWLWSRLGVDGSPRGDGNVLLARGFVDSGLVHFPFVPLLEGDSVYLSGVFSMFRLDAKARKGSVVNEYKKPSSEELQRYTERSEGPLYTVTSWKRDLDPGAPEDSPSEVLVTSYVSDRIKAADFMGYDITVEIPIRSLVAYDATSGKLLWKTGKDLAPADARGAQPRRLRARPEAQVDDEEDPFPDIRRRVSRSREVDDGATVKEFSYTSPVIVRRGLVIAGGWMQRGYVSSLVRALDIRTGALVWETMLSSSQLELTMFGEMAREPFGGMIAEHDNVIYYSTQMGVIAALEIDSGRLRWLTTYDVIEVQASLHRQAVKRRIVWGSNPLLVVGNALIATPRDSEYLYAIDTGRGPGGPLDGGRILWQVHNPDRHTQLGADLRDLLGYTRGQLYFSSPTGITSLDLGMLDPAGSLPAGRLEPRRARWPSPPSSAQLIAGSGALTAAGIVYCDGESLGLVSLDLRQQSELVPRPLRRNDPGVQADLGTYPGRIHVSPGLILMTSRHFVSAFTLEPAPAR